MEGPLDCPRLNRLDPGDEGFCRSCQVGRTGRGLSSDEQVFKPQAEAPVLEKDLREVRRRVEKVNGCRGAIPRETGGALEASFAIGLVDLSTGKQSEEGYFSITGLNQGLKEKR